MREPETFLRKGYDGWEAKTEIPLDGITIEDHNGTCPALLTIRTAKTSRGGLATSASVAFRSGAFMTHRLYQDYSQRYTSDPAARCTEKNVQRMHDAALADRDLIVATARAHYES